MPDYQLSSVASYLQYALNGTPIAIALPPGQHEGGRIVCDTTTGNFYIRGTTALNGTAIWIAWPGGSAGIFPLLYTVDNRYGAPPTPNGPWPSLNAARTQLIADGYGPGPNGPATILTIRGRYVENFQLDPGISLASMGGSFAGAELAGTVTVPDPGGAATAASINGFTIAPVAGDALVFNGTAQKTLDLTNVRIIPGAGRGIVNTNTNPASRIVGSTSDTAGTIGYDGTAGTSLFVWLNGGISGTVRSLQNDTTTMQISNSTVYGAGVSLLGSGSSYCRNVRFTGPAQVVSGTDHTMEDCSLLGAAGGISPLDVQAGAKINLLGTIRCSCDGSSAVVISGSGSINGTPLIEAVNGDLFDDTLVWQPDANHTTFRPRLQLEWTVDPPLNPYPVPGRFETLLINGPLSGTFTFEMEASQNYPAGHEIVAKNLDPTAHRLTFRLGSTVDNGLETVPIVLYQRDYRRLRTVSGNRYIMC